MKQHLMHMSSMIASLKNMGEPMSNELQVLGVIQSLPDSWDVVKTYLTHTESIHTFMDVSRHCELEEERQEVARSSSAHANIAESSKGSWGLKYKWRKHEKKAKGQGKKKQPAKTDDKGQKRKKKELDKSKVQCYVCGKL